MQSCQRRPVWPSTGYSYCCNLISFCKATTPRSQLTGHNIGPVPSSQEKRSRIFAAVPAVGYSLAMRCQPGFDSKYIDFAFPRALGLTCNIRYAPIGGEPIKSQNQHMTHHNRACPHTTRPQKHHSSREPISLLPAPIIPYLRDQLDTPQDCPNRAEHIGR